MAGGLKEVRERIGSVQNTMQITSAMKMVSAAKLRRAQDAITRIRPYAEKIQEIITNVSSTLNSSEGVMLLSTDFIICVRIIIHRHLMTALSSCLLMMESTYSVPV